MDVSYGFIVSPLIIQGLCNFLGDWDPSVVPINDLFRALQLALEAAMLEPMTQVNGFIVIIDFHRLTLTQCLQCTPGTACMLMEWVQECIPLRFKAVHIVNNPTVFQILFACFRPFLNAKIRKRVRLLAKALRSIIILST